MAENTFRYIVRVADTDLDGHKKIRSALRKIKGVSYGIANAICISSGVDESIKVGDLADADVKKLDATVRGIAKIVPPWMLNRRHDPESGEDRHAVVNEIAIDKEFDLRRLQKIKSYRGLRHAKGLPVRGQRTKSNFRRNKGKGLGVAKAKAGKKQ